MAANYLTFTNQERKNIFDKFCWYFYQNQNFRKINVFYEIAYMNEAEITKS